MCFTPEEDGANSEWGERAGPIQLHDPGKSKTRAGRMPAMCAKHRWGRLASWNLGGQDVHKLDVAGRDLDVVSVQEVSRGEEGWITENTELFHWVLHRAHDQWRATGVGFANDKLDCVVGKVATNRGVWILARLKSIGRVVVGSLHCHTGTTNAVYQAAAARFVRECPRKWRQYSVWCGVDANEQPTWSEAPDEGGGCLGSASNNLNELAIQFQTLDVEAVAPRADQWRSATHFPRDVRRRGRQIDMIWKRRLDLREVNIDANRRHVIGTDHALLYSDVFGGAKLGVRWGNDSRPRYMKHEIPPEVVVDAGDLSNLARRCTGPRVSDAYKDTDEIKEAIRVARSSQAVNDWKIVHRLRRHARRHWEATRLTRILNGDWRQYRALQKEKKRKTGWWGSLLQNDSSRNLTKRVQKHLESKLVNEYGTDWDDLLQLQIDNIELRGEFVEFSISDIREVLHEMKPNSAVGPDGISVAFLRSAASDDVVGPQVLSLVNHIVSTLAMPAEWEKSFLALLAKISTPLKPSDLRPICVSSAFHKMVSKLVCRRALPAIRSGSKVSGCGKGRQAADVIGTMSRVRDVTAEWGLPTLLCKLDISGAFDKLDRLKVAEFLKKRLADKDLEHELKYLLAQLRTYCLAGTVPRGEDIQIWPNVGIKQGAPESAEVFGLVMDDILTHLIEQPGWGVLGKAPGILTSTSSFTRMTSSSSSRSYRVSVGGKILERCLARAGLQLAPEKTKIIASADYRGPRAVQVGGTKFEIAPPPPQGVGESPRLVLLPAREGFTTSS